MTEPPILISGIIVNVKIISGLYPTLKIRRAHLWNVTNYIFITVIIMPIAFDLILFYDDLTIIK